MFIQNQISMENIMDYEIKRIDIKDLKMGNIIIEYNSLGYTIRIQVYDPPFKDNGTWKVNCITRSNQFFEYHQLEGSEKQYLEETEIALVFEKH